MHRFLRGALFTVVVPILVGVIAGTITYFVGMILGCIIAIVVAKVRGRSAYQALSLEDGDEEEEQARNEKEVYAELPEYDSPPVYEESAEKEVVDEER
jgi:Na+/H+-translocating membrane pyrophosphatase